MGELKSDIRPILLRFGVALALSYAGFLYTRIRSRRVKSLLPPPSSPKASGCDDNRTRNTFSAKCPRVTISSITQENDDMHRCRIIIGNSLPAPKSPSSSSTETPQSDVESLRSSITAMEKDTYEEEIKQLKNTVRAFQERERNLEAQLMEYYGLKEQESAATELQNRLKLKNMESKLLSLKIESLRTENKRLEQQAAEHAKVVSSLEIARSKIRVLKNKLRSEAEHNREQILQLKKRVEKLQIVDRDSGADANPMKLKDLEHDVEQLRESNARLRMENADLAQRLEKTQVLANCMIEDPEAEMLKHETEHLRRENETLAKEVEQLQVDRCSDVEELVYLRWINACLRYELRNYEAPSGRTAARDLSKTLSPKSEEIAKQLILEYATVSEVAPDRVDFDLLDEWSSSRFSCLTDSSELDNTSFCNSSSTSGKTNLSTTKKKKLFGKLRKLILGKDAHEENPNPNPNYYNPKLVQEVSSSDSSTGRSSTLGPRLGTARHSLDIQRLRGVGLENDKKDWEHKRRNSDLGSVYHLVQTDDHLGKYVKALRDSWQPVKT